MTYVSAVCLHFLFTISDQSILDEHVDRVFNEDSKGHNVSTAFAQFESSSNRHLSASFNMGYRTLDRHHPAQSHFGKLFVYNTYLKKILNFQLFVYIILFTSGSQMTTAHGSYRGPSHHSMAGDSGYFHSGSRSAKSYSDTDFGKLFVYIFYKCSAVCLHFCFCFFF